MRRVRVLSKKYDGSLRDEYATYLQSETDETITLFSVPGLKYWDHRKAAWFEAQDGLIEIYFKHKWYNVWHVCEQVSNTNLIYTNIALPATFQAQQLEWTDLDLDYRVHLDNSIERLDQADFEHNTQHLRYPPEVIEQAWAACREVEAGLAHGTFPFDYDQQVELYHRLKAELHAG
jgi:protein associated with RNAse G/E